MKADINQNTRAIIHIHPDYPTEDKVGIKVPSPKDINSFIALVDKSFITAHNPHQVSLGTISSVENGHYMLNFTGSNDDIEGLPRNSAGGGKEGLRKLNNKYKKMFRKDDSMSKTQREHVFLKFLKEEI